MRWVVVCAWVAVIAIHVMPSAVAFMPRLVERLYGASPEGEIGVLLAHRGASFLAIVVAGCLALADERARPVASLVAAISMLGFLIAYARAGSPSGPLAQIATVDLVGLVPLAIVLWDAWWPRGPA